MVGEKFNEDSSTKLARKPVLKKNVVVILPMNSEIEKKLASGDMIWCLPDDFLRKLGHKLFKDPLDLRLTPTGEKCVTFSYPITFTYTKDEVYGIPRTSASLTYDYKNKTIAVSTNDPDLAEKLKKLEEKVQNPEQRKSIPKPVR